MSAELDDYSPVGRTAVAEEGSESDLDGEYSVLKALKNRTIFINFIAVIICF